MNANTPPWTTFNPDGNALLAYLSKDVKDKTLWKIAEADYGHNAEGYFKELKKIRDLGRIEKLHFDVVLSEVVCLTRWAKPIVTKDKSFSKDQLENLAIAYSCTILLTVPSDWYYNRDGENSTIVRLIQACQNLSSVLPEVLENVASLLAWRVIENGMDSEDNPYFILGLLLVALMGRMSDENTLVNLLEALMTAEEAAFKERVAYFGYSDKKWLARITHFDQTFKDWLAFHSFVEKQAQMAKDSALKEGLEKLGQLLTAESNADTAR